MNATEYRNELVEIIKNDASGWATLHVQLEVDRIDRAEAAVAVAEAHEINRMIEEENAAQRAEESGQRVPDDVVVECIQGLPTLKPMEPFG